MTIVDNELFGAVFVNDPEGMLKAIDDGADVNAETSDGTTPLHWAFERGYLNAARLLLENGADIHRLNYRGNTYLHHACNYGNEESVAFLLERGAEVNPHNHDGTTPLHVACSRGRTAIARVLLLHGADPDARDKQGQTPLDDLLKRPANDSSRESVLDLFRQYAPEMVMERFCAPGPGA